MNTQTTPELLTLAPVALHSVVGRPVESIDLYAEHAKEKAHLPANWRIYKWECFPKGAAETIYVAVTGAVCEHFKTGEHKNERNWKLRDKTTERTVNLPCGEHEAWKLEWEKRTGKCSRCTGEGEVLESWSVANGVKNRTCPKCKGERTPNDQAQRPPRQRGLSGKEMYEQEKSIERKAGRRFAGARG